MKKSLVLAMAMALGVTASAYAANPFSDVPAGHWAYDSVAKLAAAGVIEGYGDTTFGGDKLMTRYEMAQIVAKAMARGANVDKLAAEFADELDTLGVRVANLEKKADNVKITGQIRYDYSTRKGDIKDNLVKKAKAHPGVALNRLQTRIFVAGQVNDDWAYNARIQNRQDFTNNEGEDKTDLNQAYVTGKLGGMAVTAGRAPIVLADGNLYDDTAEYVGLAYGKDVKLNVYGGQLGSDASGDQYQYDNFYGASVSGKIGKLSLSAGYDIFKDAHDYTSTDAKGKTTTTSNSVAKVGEDNGVWNVNAAYTFGDVTLSATYLNSNLDKEDLVAGKDVDTDGYVVGLSYKGAKAAKAGSWGAWATYYDQGVGTAIAHTMKTGEWANYNAEGFKGYNVGVNYAFAKNIIASVDYFDLKGKESDLKDRVVFSRLQFAF